MTEQKQNVTKQSKIINLKFLNLTSFVKTISGLKSIKPPTHNLAHIVRSVMI